MKRSRDSGRQRSQRRSWHDHEHQGDKLSSIGGRELSGGPNVVPLMDDPMNKSVCDCLCIKRIPKSLDRNQIERQLHAVFHRYGQCDARTVDCPDSYDGVVQFESARSARDAFRSTPTVDFHGVACDVLIQETSQTRKIVPKLIDLPAPPLHPCNPNSLLYGASTGSFGCMGTAVTHSRSLNARDSSTCPLVFHPKATRTLFVGSLEVDITEQEVLNTFRPFGHVEQVDVKRQAAQHAYAFVRFENVDMSARAKMCVNGRLIRNSHCKIGFGKPTTGRSVYIGGLNMQTNRQDLLNLLCSFGAVSFFYCERGQHFAVATYEQDESAADAVQTLRGTRLSGSDSPIYLDFVGADIPRILGSNGQAISNFFTTNQNAANCDVFSIREMRFFSCFALSENTPESAMATSYGRRRGDSLRSSHDNKQVERLPSLRSALTLDDVMQFSRTVVGISAVTMKKSVFPLRLHHVMGDQKLSDAFISRSKGSVGFSLTKRIILDARILAEAVELISQSLDESCDPPRIAILLGIGRPPMKSAEKPEQDAQEPTFRDRTLPTLVTYLRLHECACLLDTGATRAYLFAPSDFSVDVLRLAAPRLNNELASSSDFVLFLLCDR